MRILTPAEKYVCEVFGLDDPDLIEVRKQLERQELSFMAISPLEGRILQFLIRAFGSRKIVEVGTLFGYSALCMAKVLPEGGKLITIEKNPAHHAIAQKMFGASRVGGTIEALSGDANDVLKGIEGQGPFDLIFIDANKAGYVDYLNWAEKNVRRGGLIVGDNTFLFGAMWGESDDREAGPSQIRGMKEFNSRLADSTKYNSILIPTHEGLTVAQRI